jgi:hypothetical protein
MEHEFELTFEWPNGDWTWTYYQARDFHEALLEALKQCPDGCRVHGVVRSPEGFKRGRRVESEKAGGIHRETIEAEGGKK